MAAGIVAMNGQQVLALLEDRFDGTGPCVVAESLPWSLLADTGVVPGARIMMAKLEGDGARLTGQGNLNRKLVEALMDDVHWPGEDPAELRCISKVFNEHDFAPAMYLHAVLKLAGLVRRERGFLKLTRKGRALLAEDAAGRLQAELFRTTFTRYNLAYLDRAQMSEIFAPQISLILFLVGRFATDWRPADALMRSVTIPMNEMPEPAFPSEPALAFSLRVLRYLCWFGLIEEARRAANDNWRSPALFRKTRLYDQFLAFALD